MSDVKTIRANGLEFGYLDAGPADGPAGALPARLPRYRALLAPSAARPRGRGLPRRRPLHAGIRPTGIPDDGAYQAGAIASDANALHEAFGADGDAVLIGHDWGAIAAYGATAHAPERWRRAVTMSVPPLGGVLADFFDYDYGQFKRSFYIFLFQTPLAEAGAAAHDMALIDGLWRDWSPGYHDSAQDIAHVKESLRTRPTSPPRSATTGPCSTRPARFRVTRRSRRRSPPPASGRSSSCTAPTTAASARKWSTDARTTCRRAPRWNWSRRGPLPAPGAARAGQRGDPGGCWFAASHKALGHVALWHDVYRMSILVGEGAGSDL